MLYVIHGDDVDQKVDAIDTLVEEVKKKDPNIFLIHYEGVSMTEALFEELIHNNSLFNDKTVLIISHALENELLEKFIRDKFNDILISSTVVILNEKPLLKPERDLFSKATRIQEYSVALEKKKSKSLFPITDAFGERDKKRAWLLYREAIDENTEPREIHGLLVWIVKTMQMLQKAKEQSIDPAALGLKPFVISKAKSFCRNFTPIELNRLYKGLVDLYHRSQRGEEEFEESLELFILHSL